jgi:hypothetical protein
MRITLIGILQSAVESAAIRAAASRAGMGIAPYPGNAPVATANCLPASG